MTDHASASAVRQVPPEASREPARAHADGGTAGTGLLFLREEEIRLAQDLMFFAYRDFTHAADAVLATLDLGRAHHRALHFIGRNPGIAVTELLTILGITKQSLARVLTVLVERGYVTQTRGRTDRRQRLLSLTAEGESLERQVFERQREVLTAAFRDMGAPSVEGFRRILTRIMGDPARRYIDRAHARPPAARRVW
ncbi:MAG TPA: MarR family transcriptional regulator [Acidisphaera sp.]|nr:MarR family transcriptional regulator [Acidisphaera sp.]